MRALNHPCIVAFKEAFKSGKKGKLNIIMEFVEGGDLDKELE